MSWPVLVVSCFVVYFAVIGVLMALAHRFEGYVHSKENAEHWRLLTEIRQEQAEREAKDGGLGC